MRLGILSDIHDNLWNLQLTIAALNAQADELLCCGDLCSPFVMDELRKFERGCVHVLFGNNDADLFRITRKSDQRVQVYGEFFTANRDGKSIAANHFDFLARPIAQSGQFDLVCFGHNHRISKEQFGKTLALNPGPVMGVAFGPHGWEEVPATFMVCDLTTMAVETWAVSDRKSAERIKLPLWPRPDYS
jgi:putative phosphoesterase